MQHKYPNIENILWMREETCSVLLQGKELELEVESRGRSILTQNMNSLASRGSLQSNKPPLPSHAPLLIKWRANRRPFVWEEEIAEK